MVKKLEITLRKFERQDSAEICRITRNSQGGDECKEYIWKLSQRIKLYVALVDDVLVGLAGIDGNMINNVFVDEEYRHKGIGSKLMGLLEEIVANKGLGSVKLTADAASYRFFEKLGYRIFEEVGSEKTGKAFIMEKAIF